MDKAVGSGIEGVGGGLPAPSLERIEEIEVLEGEFLLGDDGGDPAGFGKGHPVPGHHDPLPRPGKGLFPVGFPEGGLIGGEGGGEIIVLPLCVGFGEEFPESGREGFLGTERRDVEKGGGVDLDDDRVGPGRQDAVFDIDLSFPDHEGIVLEEGGFTRGGHDRLQRKKGQKAREKHQE